MSFTLRRLLAISETQVLYSGRTNQCITECNYRKIVVNVYVGIGIRHGDLTHGKVCHG